MKNVLMVAEKPSLALSIAKILSNGQMHSRKGISSACQIHEYNSTFNGQQAKFKVTSVCGHVMTLDFKGYFNDWDAVAPIELFSATTYKKEAMPKLNIVKHLEQEGKGIDYLVLWLDCDKEGENICFEVIDAVRTTMKTGIPKEKVIYRAHFSAITDKDIKKAMQTLGEPNRNESLSVDSRLELDLRIGCAFTRFQTRYFQGKYGDLDSSVISYGPCQTPTLGFCVDRHDQIQSFKPETYWKVHVVLENGLALEWERMRIFEKEIANLFLNIIKTADVATVSKIQEKEKVKQRPQALNTVELLRIASSGLGIGPQQTMVAAERLYTQGFISYPRTETTHYPENFDLHGPLRQQGSSPWGSYVSDLLKKGMNKPRKGADAGDHPPITPMRAANSSDLSGDMWRIYEYVAKHFIATVSYDCKYMHKVLEFDVNNEKFSCEGRTTSDPGFTAVFDWQSSENATLPNVTLNQKINVKECKLLEKQTSAPDYLTESELITLMEKNGIGTDASIPVHINNICQRNYVTVGSGRRLIPTSLGIVLVHGYQKIDIQLVLSTMRSSLEKQLNLIASGEAEQTAITQYYLDIFERKFDYFMKHIDSMDDLFECSFTKLSESGTPMSRCGKCRRYMKFIAARPIRLHCATCDETYTLPQDGFLKLYQELKCPLDEFELLLWSKGPKAKGTPICPFCYSHPPFDDMQKNTGCNGCLHPTCKHALPQLSVSACTSCDDGTIVLEPYTASKWQMSCNSNKCNGCWKLFKNATKIVVTEDECECGAILLDIHYNKDKSPFADNETRHKGCVFCDPLLTPHVRNVSGQSNNMTSYNRSSRGRGGSRGRRGRGDRGGSRGGSRGGGRGRGKRGRGRGRGRGRSSDEDDSGYVSRPRTSHNLSEFLNF